jgi:multiple sugar transport system permease protein
MGRAPFVGFSNYIRILSDPRLLNALKNTLIFMVLSVVIELCLGIAIASLLAGDIPFRRIFISILIIPLATSPIVAGIIWRIMLDEVWGPINTFLRLFDFAPIPFISNPSMAIVSILAMNVWAWLPFTILVMTAALMALPRAPFEAALVDGASSLKTFRYITLPMLRPVILIVVFLRFIENAKIFDAPWGLTYGGPGTASETLSIWGYIIGTRYYQLGLASALGFIIWALIFGVTWIGFRYIWKD